MRWGLTVASCSYRGYQLSYNACWVCVALLVQCQWSTVSQHRSVGAVRHIRSRNRNGTQPPSCEHDAMSSHVKPLSHTIQMKTAQYMKHSNRKNKQMENVFNSCLHFRSFCTQFWNCWHFRSCSNLRYYWHPLIFQQKNQQCGIPLQSIGLNSLGLTRTR